MKEKLTRIFEEFKSNCRQYEKEGKQQSLLNEIGAMRGVAFCMEELGITPAYDDEFFRLIALQQMLLGDEAEPIV